MSPFDDMPNIPPCPKCGHAGDGLNWTFPLDGKMKTVQCACLACGFHGAERESYDEAAKAFKAGEAEHSDSVDAREVEA